MNYYNDFDPNSVALLQELIAQGLISDGIVDDRSILDVEPSDLRGFTQCHFFAGAGVWSYALRLAGWPDDRPVWTGSPPCFTAGVLVTTKRGFVPIEEVVVGDLCLTHTGAWQRVVRTGSAMKETVTLVGHGHFGLQTTHDHPFFAKSRKIRSTRRDGKPIKIHSIGDSHWRNARDMLGHWWAMPRAVPESDLSEYPSGYSQEEIGLLSGLYVGDGWISKGNSEGRLILGVSESKADEIEAVLPGVQFARHKNRTGVRLTVNDRELGLFLRSQFGQGSTSKTIPLWMLNCSSVIRNAFIAGWDLTDGTREETAGSRRITTASRRLAVIGRMLLVTMGYSASIRKIETPDLAVIEGREANQADYYTISRSRNDRYTFSDDLHQWFKVKKVEDRGRVARVYDIEVTGDHSYVADGIVVHNCQPFSVAGKQDGKDDQRHLSPKFAGLVGSCCPPLLFGEQVASAKVFGPSAKGNRPGFEGTPPWAWLDDLCDRLEAAHYAVGANDVPNAGVGAPHIRQRTYFGAIRLADANDAERRSETPGGNDSRGQNAGRAQGASHPEGCSGVIRLADSLGERLERHGRHGDDRNQSGRFGALATGSTSSGGGTGGLAYVPSGKLGNGAIQSSGKYGLQQKDRSPGGEGCGGSQYTGLERLGSQRPGPVNGFWRDVDWLFCRDGKWRPTQPGLKPLVNGSPARVGRLRVYGNAINPWVAKVYIEAFCEAVGIPLTPHLVDAAGLNCHL